MRILVAIDVLTAAILVKVHQFLHMGVVEGQAFSHFLITVTRMRAQTIPDLKMTSQ
jgi:hypothetical protein